MEKWSIPQRARTFALVGALLLMMMAVPIAMNSAVAQDTGITTRVLIAHAGPEVGKVEVHINNEEVLDEFEYGDMSDWIDLDPGSVRFSITADRAGFNYLIFDTVYPVPAGNDYYVVITDSLILSGTFDTASVVADGSRVQITHGSDDTPAVNVVATGENVELATELGYGRTSESQPLPAGTYDFEVTRSDTGEALATIPGIVIDPGKSYVLVLVGTPGDEDHPLNLVVLSTDLLADATPTA